MKLSELNPRWQIEDIRTGRRVGVNFDCPGACCAGKPSARDEWDEMRHSGAVKLIVAVPFKIALDGAPWSANGWDRTGDTFETLTLSPSIFPPGHWHGYIRNGEIETC